ADRSDPARFRDEVLAEVRRRACAQVLSRFLQRNGVTPSRKLALEYLTKIDKKVPAEFAGRSVAEREKLADDPDMQLEAAWRSYVDRVAPEAVNVTDAEVEAAYRLNQRRFLLPARAQIAVIEIAKSRAGALEAARSARARLLQAENFDRVAAELSPDGVTVPTVKVLELYMATGPDAKTNTVSEVLEDEGHYFVVKLKERGTLTFVSLEKASPLLREELAAKKRAVLLRTVLARMLYFKTINF
ncbi:MAG: peptidylprolyl isomerase, partial [Victivallaceae bacterium]|nr:peptidylprolyl isomerase [Victivallaceae bacterium]